MRVFIDFWKLETENHKLSFENSFCFLSILGCQISFCLKNKNLFLKIENKEKKQLPNIPSKFLRIRTFELETFLFW